MDCVAKVNSLKAWVHGKINVGYWRHSTEERVGVGVLGLGPTIKAPDIRDPYIALIPPLAPHPLSTSDMLA